MSKIMDQVLEIVNEHRISDIVAKTGLDEKTIYYWKTGKTTSARSDTLDVLLDALGYEVHIVPKPTSVFVNKNSCQLKSD